eukprot:scaffold10954_cov267-Chaetoceros_neogracile.AAC.1
MATFLDSLIVDLVGLSRTEKPPPPIFIILIAVDIFLLCPVLGAMHFISFLSFCIKKPSTSLRVVLFLFLELDSAEASSTQ